MGKKIKIEKYREKKRKPKIKSTLSGWRQPEERLIANLPKMEARVGSKYGQLNAMGATRIDPSMDGGRQSGAEEINRALKEMGVVWVNPSRATLTKCAKNKQTIGKQRQVKWEKERERRGGKGRGKKTREKEGRGRTKLSSPPSRWHSLPRE